MGTQPVCGKSNHSHFFQSSLFVTKLQTCPFSSFTMKFTSTLATTALLLCSASAFSPSSNNANNNRGHVEAQSTLAAPGFVGTAPSSFTPEPKMKSPTVRRPKWIVSSSTKEATPATPKAAMQASTVVPGIGRDEALAKKKMIAEKRQWTVAKQDEVQNRVSLLRERNAARLAQERGGLSP